MKSGSNDSANVVARHFGRRGGLWRRARRAAIVAAVAISSLVLTVSPSLAAVGPNVLVGVATLPNSTPAAGADVTVTTLPPFAGMPELTVGRTTADAAGRFDVAIPATDALVAQVDSTGHLRLLVTLVAESAGAGGPRYFKAVTPTSAAYQPSVLGGLVARFFRAPSPTTYALGADGDIDPYALATAGRETLADHAEWLVSLADPYVAALATELSRALANEGDSAATISAYEVRTTEGVLTYVTDAPATVVVEPTDTDVWAVAPIVTATPPAAVDTTNEADTVDSAGLILDSVTGGEGGGGKTPRGTWVKTDKASDCIVIAGPHRDEPRYRRVVCYELDVQQNDTSKDFTYWQYSLKASGSATDVDFMYRLWVEAKPAGHGSATPQFDGVPVPGETNTRAEPCDHKTDSLYMESGGPVSAGFSRSWERVSCETYGPKSYGDQGHWATIWTGNDKVDSNVAREVLLMMPIKTRTKDGAPAWTNLTGQWVRSY